MPIFANNFVTSDDAIGGSVIEKSLRFNRPDNAKLSKTLSSVGNRKKWTFSVWAKFPNPNDSNTTQIFSYQQGHVNHRGSFYKGSSGVLNYQLRVGGSRKAFVTTDAQLKDPSAWYHIVLVIDSDQGSSTNRVKIYINGVQQSVVYHDTPTSGFETWINSTQTIYLGAAADENGGNMYLAECNFIDGSVLTPSSFGFTDPVTGIWMPKRYEGTYGTNGFYLDFSDNSSTAALGIDKSPNGNDWTTTNFSVSAGSGNDSLEDTPTNNFPILNPIAPFGSTVPSLSNGGLDFSMTSNNMYPMSSFMIPRTGKWYAEVVFTAGGNSQETVIVSNPRLQQNSSGSSATHRHNAINYYNTDIRVDDSDVQSSLTAVGLNNVIGICVDRDAGTVFFKNNNVQIGTPVNLSAAAGSTEDLIFGVGRGSSSGNTISGSFNFGQRPFSYTPPAGFRAVCARNILPDSSIVKPQKHFETLLYTGNSVNNRAITGLGFSPDLVWIKRRSGGAQSHFWVSRGITISDSGGTGNVGPLSTNDNYAQSATNTDGGFVSFDIDGFTLGKGSSTANADAPYQRNNADSGTYAAWCWKAGGAAVSNSDGSITSSVSANTEAGFSIVTWTGTGSDGTIGHGLGAVPSIYFVKRLNSAKDWYVQIGNLDGISLGRFLKLNSNTTINFASDVFAASADTSTVLNTKGDTATNGSGDTYIAYCWTDIPGYSKFGSYVGNGASDGSYVYLGFRPAWLMIKNTETSTWWFIYDVKRETYNPMYNIFGANVSDAEYYDNAYKIDILSNGFKARGTQPEINKSGDPMIYMAFAEQPNPTPFDTSPNAR